MRALLLDSGPELLKEVVPNIKRSNGMIDIKVNHVETPDKKAARIADAGAADGPGRIAIASPEPINLLKGMAAPYLALPVHYPAIPQIP